MPVPLQMRLHVRYHIPGVIASSYSASTDAASCILGRFMYPLAPVKLAKVHLLRSIMPRVPLQNIIIQILHNMIMSLMCLSRTQMSAEPEIELLESALQGQEPKVSRLQSVALASDLSVLCYAH